MKFVLFVTLIFGAAPMTPEHYTSMTAEFEDQPACEAAAERFRKFPRARAIVACMPKATATKAPAEAREAQQGG